MKPRFSLRTLVCFILLLGCLGLLVPVWGPWLKLEAPPHALHTLTPPRLAPHRLQLAAWTENNEVLLWNGNKGSTLTIPVKAGGYPTLVYSRDGTRLLGCWDDALNVIDTATGKVLLTAPYTSADAYAQLSPDGNAVAIGYWRTRNCIEVWNVSTQKREHLFEPALRASTQRLPDLTWSPDSKRLVANGWTICCAWDVEHEKALFALTNEYKEEAPGALEAAQHATELNTLLKLNSEGRVQVQSAVTPDGRRLLTQLYGDATFYLWDVDSGKLLRTLPAQAMALHVEFSADGKRARIEGSDPIAGDSEPRSNDMLHQVWDLENGVKQSEMRLSSNEYSTSYSEFFDTGFTRVIHIAYGSSSAPPTSGVWDLRTGAKLNSITANGGPLYWPELNYFIASDTQMDASKRSFETITRVDFFDLSSGARLYSHVSPQAAYTRAGIVDIAADGRHFVEFDQNHAAIWELTRPMQWWGPACLWQFWLTALCGGAWLSSVYGDFRRLRRARRGAKARPENSVAQQV